METFCLFRGFTEDGCAEAAPERAFCREASSSGSVGMRLPSTDAGSDFWICAFPGWPASPTISPPAMEEAQAAEGEEEEDRALRGGGPPGARRGCTNSRWPREPEPWPYTTRTPSSRTASRSTAPSSSSGRTT